MKSVEELMAIKSKMLDKVVVENAAENSIRIVVGMATCGIAAGAKPVMNAFVEGTAGMDGVKVIQTGCIGICQFEPVVEVHQTGREKVTYVKMTAEKAAEIIEKHIKGGAPVVEYTIGAKR